MKIREQFKQTEKLYHFTSFDTALKIIESNRLRFGRLDNMNDIHEADKIMFVNENGQPFDKFPSELLDALHDEVYRYRQISLTADDPESGKKGFDLHQMRGLYADKARRPAKTLFVSAEGFPPSLAMRWLNQYLSFCSLS